MSLPDKDELQKLLSYDQETGKLTWKPRENTYFKTNRAQIAWNTRYANKEAFTSTSKQGYKVGAIYDINYRASRVIYKLVFGIDADNVDHINGVRTDNRLINLRNIPKTDNQKNMKRFSNNTSGVTGVSWNPEKSKWMVNIGVKGKTIRKYCNTFNEAINKRKQLEIEYDYHQNHGR